MMLEGIMLLNVVLKDGDLALVLYFVIYELQIIQYLIYKVLATCWRAMCGTGTACASIQNIWSACVLIGVPGTCGDRDQIQIGFLFYSITHTQNLFGTLKLKAFNFPSLFFNLLVN